MEVLPILFAVGSTLFTSVNTYLLRCQSYRLKLLKGKYEVSLNETKKCINEKDTLIEYVYKLYNIATELQQSLQSIASLHHRVVMEPHTHSTRNPFYHIVVYIDTDVDIHSDWFSTHWDKHKHPTQTLHFSDASDELHRYVCLLAQFLVCIEERKHQKTAIHAFHAGGVHTVVEAFSHVLHNSTTLLHLPIMVQKQVARQMQMLLDTSTQDSRDTYGEFCSAVQSWKTTMFSIFKHIPLHDPTTSSHEAIATLLSPAQQGNLLTRYLLSHATNDSLMRPDCTEPYKTPKTSFDGICCISQQDTYIECVVSNPTIAQQLCEMYQSISSFHIVYTSIYTIITTLDTTRNTFNQRAHIYQPLLIYIVWKQLRKHQWRFSKTTRKAVKTYIRKYASDLATLRNQPFYPFVKQAIKSNTARIQKCKTLFIKCTTDIAEVSQSLFQLYQTDVYESVLHTQHPDWCQCLDTLHTVVESTRDVIQQDMDFRRGLIEPR